MNDFAGSLRRRATVGHPSAVVLCPWDAIDDNRWHLPHAREEAEWVAAFLADAGYALLPGGKPLIGASADFAAMNNSLEQSAALLHYSGHGTIEAGEEALIIHARAHSTAHMSYGLNAVRRLEQELGHRLLFDNRPLFLLNSCRTGRAREFGGKREDLCAFLMSRGAGAVIASAFPIFDRMGAQLGQSFYQHTAAVNVGEALLRSRQEIEEWARDQRLRSWPAWTLLMCNGDPYLTLPHLSEKSDRIGGTDE
jgi:CHAT domain-containing protein